MIAQTSKVSKNYLVILFVFFFFLIFFILMTSTKSEAMPVFARKYNMICVACHAAFPRLIVLITTGRNDNSYPRVTPG